MMTYGSVCSGIEAVSVAWESLGYRPLWFSEIEPFPSAVLARHWPDVPNLGDMNLLPDLIRAGLVPKPDILVGGTPCQAFSIAGLRNGLKDERGQLTLKFVELADVIDPEFIVWENVPGVLSDKTNAFGYFLGALAGEDEPLEPPEGRWSNAGCVFGPKRTIAWRVCDAQYFGVAQRRRRVFVVACPRNGADPTRILFEREGLRRDTPPSRETGTSVAALTANGVGTCGADDNQGQAGHQVTDCIGFSNVSDGSSARNAENRADPLTCRHGDPGMVAYCMPVSPTLRAGGNRTGGDRPPGTDVDTMETLVCMAHGQGRAETCNHEAPILATQYGDVAGALAAEPGMKQQSYVRSGFQVRRLTVTECERLQGFPDGHTAIIYRGKPAANGPRYKALGNSMAVPCMRWLGKRILDTIPITE